jgi:hypothetical protein
LRCTKKHPRMLGCLPSTIGEMPKSADRASGCSPRAVCEEIQNSHSHVQTTAPRATFCAAPSFTSGRQTPGPAGLSAPMGQNQRQLPPPADAPYTCRFSSPGVCLGLTFHEA